VNRIQNIKEHYVHQTIHSSYIKKLSYLSKYTPFVPSNKTLQLCFKISPCNLCFLSSKHTCRGKVRYTCPRRPCSRGNFLLLLIEIKSEWLKWRTVFNILCDHKVPLKLKGKFYQTIIRQFLLYGSKY